jgi:RimJ/RimL family protein N-acetyltransferase
VSSSSILFSGPIPTLTDDRITVREVGAGDRQAVVEHFSDPQIRRWQGVPRPFTEADTDAWLNLAETGCRTGRRYQFAIESQGRLIGEVNLRPQEPGLARIGFGLTAAYRSQGLMARALRLVLPWGFGVAGLEVVHWRAEVGNWASRRVAWAVGFQVPDTPVAGLVDPHGPRVDGWLGSLRAGDPLQPRRPWYDSVPIHGERIRLRAHHEDDVPRIVQACLDPQTQYWLSGLPADYAAPNAREHLEQIRSDQAGGRAVYWAVADPDDGRMLGELAVFVHDPQDPYGEVGYWAHPDARDRGATTEAVRLAARHALLPVDEGGLGLSRLVLRAGASNAASLRVAERSGFTRTGRDRAAHLNRDGARSDTIRFDLLPDELPAVR